MANLKLKMLTHFRYRSTRSHSQEMWKAWGGMAAVSHGPAARSGHGRAMLMVPVE
jgi:hypothetical protein